MKPGTALALGLFVIAIVVGLLQVWLELWGPNTFFKLELTIGALWLVAVVFIYVKRESDEYRAIHDGDDLNRKS